MPGGEAVAAVISAVSIAAIALALSLRYGESLVRTAPVAVCGAGIVLYGLAFLGRLSLIVWIAAACLAALLAVLLLKMRREGAGKTLRRAAAPLREPQVWINAAALALIALLAHRRLILEWDAYNFWGPDIKSLYFRDGFAGYASNVASGFGDYPPFTQLEIWLVLRLRGSFDEGLIFSGYFLYSGLLLFSALDGIRAKALWKKLLLGAAGAAMLFVLPSVADSSWYRSVYVDPVMGMLFGCLLMEITGEGEWNGWRTAKCAIFLFALALTKSVGLLWCVYAVALFLIYRGFRGNRGRAAALLLPPAAAAGSWWMYCRVMDRTTYLTRAIAPTVGSQLRAVLSGTFFKDQRTVGLIRAWLRAFLLEPVHREWTPGVDLTPALAMLLIFALLLAFRRAGWLEKGKAGRFTLFTAGMFLVTLGVLLMSHLTIFYSETQYLESANMLTQMTRYGGPMYIGLLMWAFHLCAVKLELSDFRELRAGAVLPGALAALIVLCAGWKLSVNCLFPAADSLNPQRLERREEFAQSYEDMLTTLEGLPLDGGNRRVLVLLNSAEYNPIVTFLASPMSVETMNYSEATTREDIDWAVETTMAGWIYVQDGSGPALENLRAVLPGGDVGALIPAR